MVEDGEGTAVAIATISPAGPRPAVERDGARAALARQGSVQFLLFELEGQRYGVDVAQIEAIVQASTLRKEEGAFTYGPEKVAVDSLAHWVGLGSGDEVPTPETAPRHLLLSRNAGALNGLLVDMPRDIISLPLERIHALPPLIRHLLVGSPLWGVGRTEEGLVLLVDPASRGTPGVGARPAVPDPRLAVPDPRSAARDPCPAAGPGAGGRENRRRNCEDFDAADHRPSRGGPGAIDPPGSVEPVDPEARQ